MSGISAATIALSGAAASAAGPHPWCMVYQEMTGTVSCYYDSYAQCRATAAGGNGGACMQNPAFRAEEPPTPASAPRRRHDR